MRAERQLTGKKQEKTGRLALMLVAIQQADTDTVLSRRVVAQHFGSSFSGQHNRTSRDLRVPHAGLTERMPLPLAITRYISSPRLDLAAVYRQALSAKENH